MDTPKWPAPQDEGEKQVLEKLTAIQDQLQLRKRDRTTYVRTQDVMVLYDQAIEQVRKLNSIRDGKQTEENRGTILFHGGSFGFSFSFSMLTFCHLLSRQSRR
jgi:hypothetical protein